MRRVQKSRRKADPKKPPKQEGLVTRAEAAEALGVAPTRINRWVEDGAPVAKKGSRGHQSLYDLEALRAWKDRRPAADPAVSLGEQRARLAAAQAEERERKNLIMSGVLVLRAEAVAEGGRYLTALRSRLMRVPDACVNKTLPQQYAAVVREAIVEALRELEGWKTIEDAEGKPTKKAS